MSASEREELRAGVLLVNLGTPHAPTAPAVRRFLREFLSDPRVVSLPRALWWPILHGIILPRRPRRVADAYRKIWLEAGSPLQVYSSRIAHALAEALQSRFAVGLGMRYGDPPLALALSRLCTAQSRSPKKGSDPGCAVPSATGSHGSDPFFGRARSSSVAVGHIIVLPLFPQYSSSTTGSVIDAVRAAVRRMPNPPELRFINDYHAHAAYIDAVARSISEFWSRHGRAERLIMSFHGLPESYALAGDPYGEQCRRTATLVAQKLELRDSEWETTFQSRFGWQRWLQPYLDERLRALARSVARVDVVCPGFATDCLETLEEIAIRAKQTFLAAGGRELRYVPALNDSPGHIAALASLLAEQTEGDCR
jgi:ferrochelatase